MNNLTSVQGSRSLDYSAPKKSGAEKAAVNDLYGYEDSVQLSSSAVRNGDLDYLDYCAPVSCFPA